MTVAQASDAYLKFQNIHGENMLFNYLIDSTKIQKLIFTFTTLLFVSINTHAQPTEPETLTVGRPDGSHIDYYILEPQGTSPSDILLLVLQGSDCNSVLRINSIFSDYKNVWPEADLLLIEKYGLHKKLSYDANAERKDCPAAYLKNDNPTQRVTDAKAVLDVVRKNHTYKHIVVVGGSEGALIANLLAASVDYLSATIAFNGGGRWFLDDVLHSITSEYKNADEAKESVEGFTEFAQQILTSEPFDMAVSGHGYEWFHQMLTLDQLDVLQKVHSPLLITQGGMDVSVSPTKVNEMMLVLQESQKNNIKYLTYEKLDHGFKNSDGRSERKSVVNDMNAWLKTILIKNPNN